MEQRTAGSDAGLGELRQERQDVRPAKGNGSSQRPARTMVPVTNADIAAVFEHVADLLEYQGENVFRVRAYRAAARTIGSLVE